MGAVIRRAPDLRLPLLGWLVGLALLAACGSASPAAPAASENSPTASRPAVASAGASASAPTRGGASATAAISGSISLKSAYSAITASQLPIYVAKDLGLFEKHGLKVDLTYISSSSNMSAAMLSGELPITSQGQDGVIAADLHGADLVIVAVESDRVLQSLYAQPSITSLAQLKGKKLGITRLGSVTDFVAQHELSRVGLVAGKDVTLVQVGGIPDIFTALQAKAIDAGLMSPPTKYLAEKAGFRELADISKENVPYYGSAITVRRSWLAANRPVAVRYLQAFHEAAQVIHQQPAKAGDVLAKYTKESDRSLVDRSVSEALPTLPIDQLPKTDAIKIGLDQAAVSNPKAKQASPEQFIDPSVIQEVQKSA